MRIPLVHGELHREWHNDHPSPNAV
jgi:hypothetical protein